MRVTRALGDLAEEMAEFTTECHQGATFHGTRREIETCWYATPFVRTRDSGALEESNYQVIFKDLKRISRDGVDDHRFGHWGCGWYERIYVRKDDPAALLAVRTWHNALSDYPVADDEHFSDMEDEMNHPGGSQCYCDDPECSIRAEQEQDDDDDDD